MSGVSSRNFDKIEFKDSQNLDAGARLRTSSPTTLFDNKFLHSKSPLFWSEELLGSATSTHSQTDALINMTVATTNDFAIRQTKLTFNYQPGKGQLTKLTASRFELQNSVIKRVGLFTGSFISPFNLTNGIFFESSGNDVSVNIAKSSSVTSIPQSQWNVDKMDGTGPSRITVDWSKTNIFILDFQWLGAGRIRFGLMIEGKIYYVHNFNASNALDAVWTSTPNLNIRYEIRSVGGSGEFNQICSTVISEGGMKRDDLVRTHSTGNNIVTVNSNNTTFALLGIRLKNSHRDISVLEQKINLLAFTASDAIRWFVTINPTINGTFTFTGLANSAVETATGTEANTISSIGTITAEGYSFSQSAFEVGLGNALRIGHTINGTMDRLILGITTLNPQISLVGSITWRELV